MKLLATVLIVYKFSFLFGDTLGDKIIKIANISALLRCIEVPVTVSLLVAESVLEECDESTRPS